jgi:dTDP-4-dehydrorhamnose 3,5-epimerase
MNITATEIPDVLVIEPRRFFDSRGLFAETHSDRTLGDALNGTRFVQDNHSVSHTKGIVRGIHFQTPPHAQAKLVRCVRGAILDVAVDLRRSSPTFGRSVARTLSADNWLQMFIPKGFGHAFLTLSDDVEVVYKVSDFYAPENEAGLIWNDPDLAIDWGVPAGAPIGLSDKDALLPKLSKVASLFD